ncbi:MAG: hypothetical protein JWP31_2140, partial [Aeromicrobium sp.]|nr:hypothetical protein [Aeromicrobium sp.]
AEPRPAPEPVAPTDYGLGTISVTNESVVQRRFTVPVTAAATGRAADQVVTLTLAFDRRVRFRGVVSPGWDCGTAVRNRRLTVLSCVASLPAGTGTTFIAKARGFRPSGTVAVSSTGDPRSDNDSATFSSPAYLAVL